MIWTALKYLPLVLIAGYSSWLIGLNCLALSRFGRTSRLPRSRPGIKATLMLAAAILLLPRFGSSVMAHFVFVVPEKDGARAKVILSEDLQPDEQVDAGLVRGSVLSWRDGGGNDVPAPLAKADDAYLVNIPAGGLRVAHGVTDLGIQQRGNGKPFLLIYCPKTIVGDPFDPKASLGSAAPVEIVPIGKPGNLKFRALAGGKPQADAPLTVILPDGTQKKLTADASGESPAFSQAGRYGVWSRYVEPGHGERDGKTYEETRHYATLVIDVASAPQAAVTTQPARLPEAASSFGAVASGGWLYVYGGHIVPTHSYSTAAVSGSFNRLNLADGHTWEKLPGGPALQGMNLAAYGGKIYRVGGMSPHNKPGEKADVYSVADCACFDPATMKWEPVPPLPQGRSSHDVAVVGTQLYAVGGWTMNGKAGNDWLDTMNVLDLSSPDAKWQTIKQPFQRRALIAASYLGKLYVMGGFTEESEPSHRVEIFDPATQQWSTGPDIPGPEVNGFAPAACPLGNSLYISVADGTLYRLDGPGAGWQGVARTTPRIVHRLAPFGSSILVIGGAANGDNLDLIEAVSVK